MRIKLIITKLACCLVICSLSTACLKNETGGALLGGAAGGILGAHFGKGSGKLAAVGIGALIGALAGGAVGQHMDRQDRQIASATTNQALETQPDNVVTNWRNPNNNHAGSVVVTKTQNFSQENKVCRDYVHTVMIDGRQEKMHGRACRDVRDARATWVPQGN